MDARRLLLLVAGTGLIAATYGLVRFAYGLYLVEVQDALGLDVAVAGLISGGASVVYCVGAVVALFAAARHPRALVIVAGLSAAVSALGMATASAVPTFAAFAIAASAGAGLASPALVAVLQRNTATAEDPRAQTIVNAGTGPGLVAAGLLALWLLPDWRLAWAIAAGFTAVVTVLVVVADRPSGTRREAPAPATFPPAVWFAAHWRLLVGSLLLGIGSAAVWNYARTLLVASDAPSVVTMIVWIALGAGGIAVMATARWTAHLGPRLAWVTTVLTVALATSVLALAPTSVPLALAACVVFGWGYVAGSGALIAWTVQLDEGRAATGTALLFITLVLGQAVGAGAIGALIPWTDHTVAFLIAAAVTAVAAVAAAVPSSPAPASTAGPRVPRGRAGEAGSSPG